MTFLAPELLLALVAIPVVVAGYVLLRRRRSHSDATALGALSASASDGPGRRRHIPFGLYVAAISLLIVGLARPEAEVDLPRIEGTAILAFDVSNSMRADDLAPTRIEAAQAAAHIFVDNQPETVRVGIVAFNDGGVITQEPTDDKAALHAAIDRLSPGGGTSLPQGIFTSLNALSDETITIPEGGLDELATANIGYFGSGVVILLSDGEQTEENDPSAVTQLAANAGVRITTVGVGSPAGTVVELDGFSLSTALDEASLRAIADATGGTYLEASTDSDLTEIYDTIDLELTVRGEAVELTGVVAGLGGLLLLFGALLSMRWFGRMP